jgi:predicted DNA-binding mobile mystery protein A
VSESSKLAKLADRSLPVGQIERPTAGWLRTLREALELTLAEMAKRLGITPPAVRSFEQAEAEDRITLASLRRTADAMGCELIYALVPRTGTLSAPAETEVLRKPRRTAVAPQTPPPESREPDHNTSKVTDLTWRTLHGDS